MKTPPKGCFHFMNKPKIALISVYNKEGIADFAKELVNLGWKIISSGGTAKHLKDAGIENTDVADITGMPAILSHRVATLHPKIHGGLLALDTPEHLAELEKYDIPWIDLVCVDFYPLQNEVVSPNATRESVIEKTDIGGPTMIRSGAKGGRITICDPADRMKVIEWLKSGEQDREEFLNNLRAKAEFLIARYTATSAYYHSGSKYKSIFGERALECAYGENAYQKPAGLYANGNVDTLAISNWNLVAGSPLSYNNICDLDRMMQTMTHVGAGFEKNFNKIPKIAIGAKHGNACGVGVGEDEVEAVDKMLVGDLRAIFGGSVMINFNVDEKIADELIHKYSPENVRRLLDVVAAPSFSPEAVEILSRKKGKCRLLVNKNIENAGMSSLDNELRHRYVRGGFLLQPNYTFVPDLRTVLPVQGGQSFLDSILAWAIGSTSNSNTITLVKDGRLVGNGVGQQDRVGAAKLAISRADDAANFADPKVIQADLQGSVAYSDSFFPFPDAPEVLINRGVKTIFSTSGSVNDEKIIELCKNRGVELILLPDVEARGFYQH
jgi:phosphoribosylaminoimidazolecarboxamide formyltransferase/IMP cyclohydrolase